MIVFKCPNCGAGMYYKISTGKLYCENCSSSIAPEDYKLTNDAAEHKETDDDGLQEVTIYTCPNCGAQLESPDDSIVSYCIYCGAEHILKSRVEKRRAPEKILPFSYTKKKCMNSYQRQMQNMLFLPKEYKDPEYLKKFSGVYIPFYRYETVAQGSMDVELTQSKTRGNKVTETVYSGSVASSNAPFAVTIDASPALDDTVADHIAPFDEEKEVSYNPAYLAGFYADCPGVDTSFYQKDVLDLANHLMYQEMQEYSSVGTVISDLPSEEEVLEKMNTKVESVSEHLLPIWFLTWRKGDRVTYAVMNGQTGKMAVDMPVEEKSYFLFVLILAAILFFPLYLAFQPTGPVTLAVTMVVTAVMMHLFGRKVRSLCERENHVFDPGYPGTTRMPEKKKEQLRRRQSERSAKQKAKKKRLSNATMTAVDIIVLTYVFGILLVVFDDASSSDASWLIYPAGVIALVAGVVHLIGSLTYVPYLEKKLLPMIQPVSLVCLFISAIVLFSGTFHDERYYICCVLCLVSCVLTSLATMRIYNLLNTRPVPSFFTREGGKNGGES